MTGRILADLPVIDLTVEDPPIEEVIEHVFAGESPDRDLRNVYRQQFRTTLASFIQYRASIFIWTIDRILEPLIYLVVWSAVAHATGGSVGGFDTAHFAAYFIVMMLVTQVTYTWVMYEYEYKIRHGSLSFALLRPIHPIHTDLVDNVSSKLITLPLMLVAAAVLVLIFKPAFSPPLWAAPCFVPALLLAFAVKFVVEWTLALSAFWTTRVSAVNQGYFVAALFLSGQMAPLSLLPYPLPGGRVHSAFSMDDQLPRGASPGTAERRPGDDWDLPPRAAWLAWVSCCCGRCGAPGCACTRRWAHEARREVFRLLWVFFRVGAMGELAYRANFFLQLLESAVDLGTALGGLAVVFSYTATLGGWRPEEVAALVGVFFLVGGAIRLVIQPSMEQLIESVREGTLDFHADQARGFAAPREHPARGDLEAHRLRPRDHRDRRGACPDGDARGGVCRWPLLRRPWLPAGSSCTASG